MVTVGASDQDSDLATAPFPDLKVTVSQTRDLIAQGLQISWTGGRLSTPPSGGVGGTDFLQVMQCWGDDPANPGQPDRTTCQYGSFLTPGASRYTNIGTDNVVAPEDAAYTALPQFPNTGITAVPFRSVTGETLSLVKDGALVPNAQDTANNQFFTKLTTNEVSWAGSGANGTGSVKFEVQTAVQAQGLGCGTLVTATDGTITGSPCWLVVVPRGATDPNSTAGGAIASGLDYNIWKHRIAVRLDFRPIGVNCAVGSPERQLSGSQLIEVAVRSWQPKLCSSTGGAAYTLLGQTESDAAIAASGTAAAPLALTSLPLDTSAVGASPTDTLTYAPVALTSVALSFAIDRSVTPTGDVPKDVQDNDHLPFTTMKLNPRLVAKLLSYSYYESLPNGADKSGIGYNSPLDPGPNARNLTYDKEFLSINDPEWAYQSIADKAVADMLEPLGRSDVAEALWSYVLSDKDAVAFLNGDPDPWGMKVNKYSSTNPAINPDQTGLQLPLDNFPKPDPIERAAVGTTPAVNLVTWRPYTNDLDTGGLDVLRGDGQKYGYYDTISQKVVKDPRLLPGSQAVIGITSAPSAAKYQIFSAALLNSAGNYISPTTDSMAAAAAAMTLVPGQTQVYSFDSTSERAKAAATAYPLTMPVYAAVNKAMTETGAKDPAGIRKDYAAFIRYAATTGQQPGTAVGELPDGFAPIPQGWRDQALAAASAIELGPQTVTPTSTPPAATTGGGGATPQIPAASLGQVPAAAAASGGSSVPAPVSTGPAPSGPPAAPLLGPATPDDPAAGPISAALPASIFAALGAAVAVPFVSRIRRQP